MLYGMRWIQRTRWQRTVSPCGFHWRVGLMRVVEEIKRALKAVNLMSLLDGKMALGNQSNVKNLGEHKVRH